MIKRLIKLNLKEINNLQHTFILIFFASIITLINLSILDIKHSEYFLIGDILIENFGGLLTNFDLTKDIMSFILWLIPNLLIVYLINISIIQNFRENTNLVLPRIKNKIKWFMAFNITITIIVIKNYLILIITSVFITFIKVGSSIFKNNLIIKDSFNYLNFDTNQYLILLYICLLNILTIIAIIFFMNNLYYIFFNSNEASIIGFLLCIVSVNITKFSILNKFIILNQGMLKRHDLFRYGFNGFNIEISILYLSIFLFLNLIIGIYIIKKRDLNNI